MSINNKRKVWVTVICFLPVVFVILIFLFIIPPLKMGLEDIISTPNMLPNLTFHKFIFTLSHYWWLLAIILIGGGVIISRWCIVRENCEKKTILIRFVWGFILIAFTILSVGILFLPIV